MHCQSICKRGRVSDPNPSPVRDNPPCYCYLKKKIRLLSFSTKYFLFSTSNGTFAKKTSMKLQRKECSPIIHTHINAIFLLSPFTFSFKETVEKTHLRHFLVCLLHHIHQKQALQIIDHSTTIRKATEKLYIKARKYSAFNS